jgi:hypothetical protein
VRGARGVRRVRGERGVRVDLKESGELQGVTECQSEC